MIWPHFGQYWENKATFYFIIWSHCTGTKTMKTIDCSGRPNEAMEMSSEMVNARFVCLCFCLFVPSRVYFPRFLLFIAQCFLLFLLLRSRDVMLLFLFVEHVVRNIFCCYATVRLGRFRSSFWTFSDLSDRLWTISDCF